MKIRNQGLLLVTIPFLLTILLCLSLFVVEIKAQEELKRQADARRVLSLANALPFHLMNIGSDLIAWRTTGQPKLLTKCQEEKALLRNVINELRNVNVEDIEEVRVLCGDTEKTIAYIDDYQANITNEERVLGSFDRHRFAQRLQRSIDSVLASIDKLSEQASQRDLRVNSIQTASFDFVMGSIVVSLLFSFAVAGLAGLIFARRLVRSIKQVGENFRRREIGEELLPPLTSADEVADLDRALHIMSDELNQAEEEKTRRRLLLNDRLRRPIENLHDDLVLMQEGILLHANEKGKRRLMQAIDNLGKLSALINELLEIDNITDGFKFSADICNSKALLDGAISCVETLAQSRQHTIINSAEGEESIEFKADQRKIEQVLINLLSNACKYSRFGEPIVLGVQKKRKSVRFFVKDHGAGLNNEQCSRIFEKFEQAGVNDASKGIGLGLPICKKIVEQHGGSIGVSSQPDEGCLFWFELPLS
jgi:signal transduction histidine kinase